MRTLFTKTLGEAWIKSMQIIISDGKMINDDNEKLKEVSNLYITIQDIDENDCILKSHADQKRIALMKEKYATCGLVGEYSIDYGSYLYDNGGHNQIEWVEKRISNKPETKSATITLHKPGEEKLTCLTALSFQLRDNALNMTIIYRSQNIFASHPGNLLALRKIQEDVATFLSVDIGIVELVVISAHIYERDFQSVEKILLECSST
jgi:thymidylate synthase